MMSDTMANIYVGKVFDLVQEFNDFEKKFEFSATPSENDDDHVRIEVGTAENAKEFDEVLAWKEAYMFLYGFHLGKYLQK